MQKHIYILLTILSAGVLMGCEGYLDQKPRKSLVVPETLDDLQALLDNAVIMNSNVPGLGLLASDDVFMEEAGWAGLFAEMEQQTYLWRRDGGFEVIGEWNGAYQKVFYSNVVLERLHEMEEVVSANERGRWMALKGAALFFRGSAFYDLVRIFAQAYQPGVNDSEMGIPLKLTARVTERPGRATLEETYKQIIGDLNQAIEFLPVTASSLNRPNKPVAESLLADLHLQLGNYSMARDLSSSLLQAGTLLDFNELNPEDPFPVPFLNSEVLFQSVMAVYSFTFSSLVQVNPILQASYAANDLRGRIFLNRQNPQVVTFKGSYCGNFDYFAGISLNELYLINSEARIRTGDVAGGMEVLNTLLEKRFEAGTFQPLEASSVATALAFVLMERRKELLFRPSRWYDLRRLNNDSEYATTLVREMGGNTYILAPGDNRYVFPIPQVEVDQGMKQNP
ncbi:RagB/SusD family nutrient uptake outer membrane protein [Litoribacter alkaliphilus]|uniref:RagB/SusD family nutrient uptake outer membrane protein n=1 Tax=Litoribacter ruber TaxID=702568 RepID=A0AAP2G2E8_9BACT|nr:RagB/SusD family nutrient uptake outer membrane protein [Litoribacter alkaliphilus]MBS9525652.1 RagB/SusD family nutrient uptake outer membrane protein [Litoribacter alkaliphilus]